MKQTKRIYWFYFILIMQCIALSSPVFGQEYPLRVYEDSDILPGVKWGCLQDSRGVMWFWGENGAMSYDGVRFKSFTFDNNLADNYIYNVAEGPDSLIYFCTFKGLDIYNPYTHTVLHFTERRGTPVRDITFTPFGMVLAHNDGASLFCGHGEYLIPVCKVDPNPGTPNLVNEVVFNPADSMLWIGMEPKGLYRADLPELLQLFEMNDSKLQSEYDTIGRQAFRQRYPAKIDDVNLWEVSDTIQRQEICQQRLKHFVPPGKPDTWITEQIKVGKQGEFWASAAGELFHLNNDILEPVLLPTESSKSAQTYLFMDDRYRYIADAEGLTVFDNIRTMHLSKDQSNHLPIHLSFCYTDYQDLLWMGWQDGSLGKLVSNMLLIYSGRENPGIQDLKKVLLFNDESTCMVSTNELIQLRDDKITTLLASSEIPEGIWDGAIDACGNILLLSETGMYVLNRRSKYLRTLRQNMLAGLNNHPAVQSLDGMLWFIARDTVYTWDGYQLINSGDCFQHSTFLYTDNDTSLWLGTWNGPVKLKNGQAWQYLTDKFRYASNFPERNWETLTQFPDSLFPGSFSALCCTQAKDSAYWFGTFSEGIVRIKGDSIRVFDQADGIPQVRYKNVNQAANGDLVFYSNQVVVRVHNDIPKLKNIKLTPNTEILLWREDSKEREYLATSQGLHVIDGERHVLLNRDFGLREDRVIDLLIQENDKVLAVQQNTIVSFSPDSLFGLKKSVNKPFVSAVHSETGLHSTVSPVQMPLGDRSLQLDLAMPDFRNESQTYFTWKLLPFDDDARWRTGKSEATYENLKPGKYEFILKAYSSNGQEITIEEPLTFDIPPYFYETVLFKLFLILMVLTGFFLILQWRIRRIEKQKLILEQLVEEKTSEILAIHEKAKQSEIATKQLETANQLAATIAHEFNNPLAIIKGNIDLLKMKILREDQVEKQYNIMDETIQRIAGLVNKLLNIRNLKEVHYTEGMKILDIHTTYEPETDSTSSSPEE